MIFGTHNPLDFWNVITTSSRPASLNSVVSDVHVLSVLREISPHCPSSSPSTFPSHLRAPDLPLLCFSTPGCRIFSTFKKSLLILHVFCRFQWCTMTNLFHIGSSPRPRRQWLTATNAYTLCGGNLRRTFLCPFYSFVYLPLELVYNCKRALPESDIVSDRRVSGRHPTYVHTYVLHCRISSLRLSLNLT